MAIGKLIYHSEHNRWKGLIEPRPYHQFTNPHMIYFWPWGSYLQGLAEKF